MSDEHTVTRPRRVRRNVARIGLANGISFTLTEDSLPVVIGRDRTCDICIPSGHVSRRHCELYLINGVLCLKDTSTNGTSVGNRTVRQESCSIKEATEILLAGETRITVTPEAEAAPAVRPAERRGSERRSHDRRESSVVVRLDRRDPDNRRGGSRRE